MKQIKEDKQVDPIENELYYWIRRCKAAEAFIEESPCDSDITREQIFAYIDWQLWKNDPNHKLTGL